MRRGDHLWRNLNFNYLLYYTITLNTAGVFCNSIRYLRPSWRTVTANAACGMAPELARPRNPAAVRLPANWNVLGAAETWRAQHFGVRENLSSSLQGWVVLISSRSSLRGICSWPLCGLWSLSLIFRAPRGLQVLNSQQWDVLWTGTYGRDRDSLWISPDTHCLSAADWYIWWDQEIKVSVACPKALTCTIIPGLRQYISCSQPLERGLA